MFLLTQLTPRKYIVVKDNGHYNVFFGSPIDPEEGHFGEVVFGPADYSSASKFFVEQTKLPEKET